MAPSQEKTEALLLCMTAMAMENKALNLTRLAEIFSQHTGKPTTYYNIEGGFRPLRKQATAVLEAMGSKVKTSSGPSTPKTPNKAASKTGSSRKKTTDRVQTGRVTKGKAGKSSIPNNLAAADVDVSSDEEDAAESEVPSKGEELYMEEFVTEM